MRNRAVITPEIVHATKSPTTPARQPVPLVVDLDGTLILGDLLFESMILLIKRSVHWVLFIPLWLMRGPAALKAEVTSRTEFDFATALFNEPFIEYLKQEKARGRQLFLATGAHESLAKRITETLGIFDGVVASTATRNVTSHEKLAVLRESFGATGFDYAGNTIADYPIWRAARQAIVVNASPRATRWARRNATVQHVFPRKRAGVWTYLRALRVHQWLKNLLLFAPLVAAFRFTDPEAVRQVFIAFISFSLCASSVYVLNDIMDVHEDRRHRRKRQRPFASGELPLSRGFVLIPALLGSAVLLALLLPWEFAAVLAAYYAMTLAYTLKLKQLEILDVLALALLYASRIFAGGAAADIPLSFWLLAFAVFVFLSLALAKRCAELTALRDQGEDRPPGRSYRVDDLPLLYSMGMGTGCIAALVLGVYINSPQVDNAYSQPQFLWAFVLLLIYWITRVWLTTHRGEMDDDPVVFAARDPVSLMLAIVSGAAIWLAV